jgi:hypothetical protein
MKKRLVLLFTCFLFSVAMAYAEAAVVVYLRAFFYPGGLTFPLPEIPSVFLLFEAGREAATLLMLAAVAILASRAARLRAACFLFCFGVWDICYYLWLKLLIGWPRSLLDWDILFLLPLPWVGPVLSPLIVALLLTAAGLSLLLPGSRLAARKFSRRDLLLAALGASLILASYFWETGAVLGGRQPEVYPWWLLGAGILLVLPALLRRI